MHLQERDIVLLKALCKSGVLNNELVQEIYDGKSSYYKKRLTQMSREGYLVRDRGYVRITSKGMAAVGVEGAPKKLRRVDMKRRVAIVRAILAKSDILFLDEPFKGLDVDTKTDVMKYLKDNLQGRTVIMVTHSIDEVMALNGRLITMSGKEINNAN